MLVQGDKHGSSFSFLQVDITIFPATFVEEAVFSPLNIFAAFVNNKVGIVVWIRIWVLCSVSLVFVSVFVLLLPLFIAIAL
jgi:hypothetical protein